MKTHHLPKRHKNQVKIKYILILASRKKNLNSRQKTKTFSFYNEMKIRVTSGV